MQDESLQHEPVYARLQWQWAWRGFTLMHVGAAFAPPILLWPALWFVQETILPQASLLYALPVFLASATFVGIVQYKQPLDAFSRDLKNVLAPRVLSPLVAPRDADLKGLGGSR